MTHEQKFKTTSKQQVVTAVALTLKG